MKESRKKRESRAGGVYSQSNSSRIGVSVQKEEGGCHSAIRSSYLVIRYKWYEYKYILSDLELSHTLR